MLDKEPSVSAMPTGHRHMVKAGPLQQAHVGGKMGWSVPPEVVKFFKEIRRPLIRSTALSTLDECPRKFLYVDKLGIQPRAYRRALMMGTIVHKMLECLFLGQSETEATSAAHLLQAKEVNDLVSFADKAGFLPSGESIEKVLKMLEEDYHKARATAIVFWRAVPFDPSEYEVLRTPDGDPVVEMVLEAKYPGLSRSARTPCDLALIRRNTEDVWIVDFKTTSFDPKIQAIPTKMSPQLALYRLVLQTHLDAWAEFKGAPERRVVGSMHAFIKKPGIKYCPNTKDKAGFSAYIERLVQWYKDLEAKDPTNPPMVLDPNRFGKPLMTNELYGRLKQFCKAAYASPNIDHFYRVGDRTCLKYNSVCPYVHLCNSDPAMWPDLIESKYIIKFREDEEDAG